MDQNTSNYTPIDNMLPTQSPENQVQDTALTHSLVDKLRQLSAGKKALMIGSVFALVSIVIVLGMIVSTSGQGKSDIVAQVTLTPSVEITPTDTIAPTMTPVKVPKLLPTISTTLAPTVLPTSVPSATSAPLSITPTATVTNTPMPTNTPLPTATPTIADTQPPITTISYPQQNGEITYLTDAKVCAVVSGVTDQVSPYSDITTYYAFDSDSFSTSQSSGYLCKTPLPNGPHTLRYKSQDKAGNMEAERTLSFTVNITGN